MTIEFKNHITTNAPIVALHSSASSSKQWEALRTDFEDRFSVYAFDLPGYGGSSTRSDFQQVSLEITALPLIEKIEELNEKVHLVGHSYGGAVALKIATMRPELVKSLTLYEPVAYHFLDQKDADDQREVGTLKSVSTRLSEAVTSENAAAGMQHFLDFWNGEGFWDQLSPNARTRFVTLASSVMSDFASMAEETWGPEAIEELSIPTLVMSGLDSPQITQRIAAKLSRTMPSARLALLPALGHMAPIFQPEWVNPRILEHITNVERPKINFSWPSRSAA